MSPSTASDQDITESGGATSPEFFNELAVLDDLQICHVSSLYTDIEKEVYSIYGSFTCFYAPSISSFVIEIPRNQRYNLMQLMTQSTIMHLIDLAKRSPAKQILMVAHRREKKIREFMRVMKVVGFEPTKEPKLTTELTKEKVKVLVYRLAEEEAGGQIEEAKY